ncbi:MAG TPA: methyltransferase domain-containing protein [Solirubrobacterales bacterium]|jgi:arsenite methyltransferase|nr:methyltransferase domain-containing protein [Solirubrobacterales bacterium]
MATSPDLGALVAADDRASCCAAVYEHPAVQWLLGGELHPGGEQTTRRSLELIGIGRLDRLLDVASGTGTSALLAARQFGCSAVGLEFGARAVEAANAAARAQALDAKVEFRQGDAEALPFADAEFDAVLCECSLCLFADKRRAVAEISRVLRPGGRFALSDVVVDRERIPADLQGTLATVACVGEALSRRGTEQLLAEAGLRLDAVEARDDDAAALARRVQDRLRGARVLGFDRHEGFAMSTSQAIELARSAQRAIADGVLGYAIFAGTLP